MIQHEGFLFESLSKNQTGWDRLLLRSRVFLIAGAGFRGSWVELVVNALGDVLTYLGLWVAPGAGSSQLSRLILLGVGM